MGNEKNIIEEGISQLEILEKTNKIRRKYNITNQIMDAVGEIGNISMGASATALSSIIGDTVTITSPQVDLVGHEAFKEYIKSNEVLLDVKYTKGIKLGNYLLIDAETTKNIAAIMMGGMCDGAADSAISEMELSAVQEAMNQMMGRAATSMTDLFETPVDITPPTIKQLTEDEDVEEKEAYVRVIFNLNIGENIKSKIVQMIEVKQAIEIAKKILGSELKEKEKVNLDGLLKQIEKDALGEIANISFGTASTFLSEVLNQKISITAPRIEIVDKGGMNEIDIPCVVLNVDYVEGLNTENILIIKKNVAAAIASLMMGGDGVVPEDAPIGEMELSAVQEAMNQMMGNSATAMSEMFERVVDISPPVVKLIESVDDLEIVDYDDDEYFVKITFELMVGDLITSQLVQAISIEEARKMAGQLLDLTGKIEEEPVGEEPVKAKETELGNAAKGPRVITDNEGVSPLIKKAKINIDVVFGNSSKKLEEILSLQKGDVVQLLEDVDEPLKILANNIHVGYGNIVSVGDNFGVEVIELIER